MAAGGNSTLMLSLLSSLTANKELGSWLNKITAHTNRAMAPAVHKRATWRLGTVVRKLQWAKPFRGYLSETIHKGFGRLTVLIS